MTDRIFASLGRATVRFRWVILLAWLAAALVCSRALPSLGSEVNNSNSQFLPANAPSTVAANLAIPLLGDQNHYSQVIVVAVRRGARLGVADAAALAREVVAARRLPEVVAARALGVSPDGHAAQLFVNAHINQVDISGEKRLIDGLERTFRAIHPPPGLELHVAGPVASNVANQERSIAAGNRTQVLSVVFIVVLLLVIFRSLLAPLVTLLPAGLALVVADRVIGELGAHGLQISEITQLLLIVLVLGAGTDYGLFLVFRVREELRGGRPRREAVAHAVERVGESITASAATVIFALLSLLLATFGIYKDLGIPLAVGIGVMLAAGLTLLPALLALLGRAAFWPSRVDPGERGEPWWGTVARRVLRRPAWALATGVLAFGGLALGALSYRSGGFGGAVGAPAGSDAAIGNALIARYFPEASANPTNLILRFATPVWDHPRSLAVAERVLRDSGQFSTLDAPLDPTGDPIPAATYARLHELLGPPGALPELPPRSARSIPVALYNAYRATALFVSADGRTVQFEASLAAGDPQSTAALHAVPAVRAATAAAARAAGATASGVAGVAAALADVAATSDRDLVHIIPIAILAIGILLALVLRSAVAPFYLIVSVALSYLAALGLSSIIFIDLRGDAGLTFVLPFLMFIFLLALGEDYNILVMTRIREEARRRGLSSAVAQAVARTGPTITSAGLVLAGTFAVLGVAGRSGPGGAQIEAIGFGLAIGVLMDTFVVRTLLVPATVTLLGRANWWPSRLHRAVDEAGT
ncbi:MAG TPA: MMPL family transporter [Acidimicrobiales bacterium]|nr:MMPL family transporter [Acidimicrobiales bacterium]